MSREGLSMRKVREILRLRLGMGLSARQVASSCKISPSTVNEYEKRIRAAGLSWPLPEGLDDAALERIVRAREGNFRHNRCQRPPGLHHPWSGHVHHLECW